MSDVTARRKEKANLIVGLLLDYIIPIDDGKFRVGAINAVAAEIEGDPPNAIEILKMPKEQREKAIRESVEAMADVDVESFDSFDDPAPEGLEAAWKGVVLKIIEVMYESNDPIAQGQAIGNIVFAAVKPLCQTSKPVKGLEDAVRTAARQLTWAFHLNIGWDDIAKVLMPAVQPLFDKLKKQLKLKTDILDESNQAHERIVVQLQAEVQEHRNHVAKTMSSSHIESRRHIEARRELHLEVDALKKQVEELEDDIGWMTDNPMKDLLRELWEYAEMKGVDNSDNGIAERVKEALDE